MKSGGRKIRRRDGDEAFVGMFCVRLSPYSEEEQLAKYRETKRGSVTRAEKSRGASHNCVRGDVGEMAAHYLNRYQTKKCHQPVWRTRLGDSFLSVRSI